MTMALEVVFDWHGLGWLYITKGLPNFWGESAYPGDLLISPKRYFFIFPVNLI
jgi:hypothetical protein